MLSLRRTFSHQRRHSGEHRLRRLEESGTNRLLSDFVPIETGAAGRQFKREKLVPQTRKPHGNQEERVCGSSGPRGVERSPQPLSSAPASERSDAPPSSNY